MDVNSLDALNGAHQCNRVVQISLHDARTQSGEALRLRGAGRSGENMQLGGRNARGQDARHGGRARATSDTDESDVAGRHAEARALSTALGEFFPWEGALGGEDVALNSLGIPRR